MSRRRIVVGLMASVLTLVTGLFPGSGYGQKSPLPPGHPPTGGSPPARPGPAAPGNSASSSALTWTAPAGWTQETPSSSMRRAQYRIPGPGGAGEFVVFYFGPGQGGDAKSNVARWAGQFRRPDGSPVSNEVKTRDIKVGDISVMLVEITGTYVGGMGGLPTGGDRPNYMLLGAIAKGPDAEWFFRATGPRTTLEPQRAAFEQMVRSIRRGQGA